MAGSAHTVRRAVACRRSKVSSGLGRPACEIAGPTSARRPAKRSGTRTVIPARSAGSRLMRPWPLGSDERPSTWSRTSRGVGKARSFPSAPAARRRVWPLSGAREICGAEQPRGGTSSNASRKTTPSFRAIARRDLLRGCAGVPRHGAAPNPVRPAIEAPAGRVAGVPSESSTRRPGRRVVGEVA